MRYLLLDGQQEVAASDYPPIKPGTTVRTTQPNPEISDWTQEASAKRKWGVNGVITNHHDSHGLYYDVKHDDGTEGGYDPTELEVVAG